MAAGAGQHDTGSPDDLARHVYVSMIRLGHPTLETLVQLGIPERKVRLAADLLVARGLVSSAGPDAWEVHAPEPALQRWADRMEQDARQMRANAANLSAMWQQATQQAGPAPDVGLELLGSAQAVALATRTMVERAERRLWWVVGASEPARRLLQPPAETAEVVLRSGVQAGILVDRPVLEVPGLLPELERHLSLGRQVRVINRLAFSGVLSDEEVVVLDLCGSDPDGDGSFQARRPNIVAAVHGWVGIVWGEAVPLTSIMDRSGHLHAHSVDARDRRILALLATGLSDQVIARDCGISTRTVERRVRDLMNRLTATTRFQAGVQAVRRGWI